MIVDKKLQFRYADAPFSCLCTEGYDVPFFTAQEQYCDWFRHPFTLGLMGDVPKFYESVSQYVIIRTTDFVPNEEPIMLYMLHPNTGATLYNTWFSPFTSSYAENGWYYMYCQAPAFFLFDYSLHIDSAVIEVRKGSTVYSRTVVRQVKPLDTDKMLYFTFFNSRGTAAGFPFDKFNASSRLDLCFEGGIQTGARKFAVEQETFRDQRYVPRLLNAKAKKTCTLTIGGSKGVPEYVGEQINNILCCDKIYVNGLKIARLGDSVPEPTVIAKGYPLVNFTVDVEIIPTAPNDLSIGFNIDYQYEY